MTQATPLLGLDVDFVQGRVAVTLNDGTLAVLKNVARPDSRPAYAVVLVRITARTAR
jgi:hypothetical protein